MIVAIEGGDQAGKRTQAGLLSNELRSRGIPSEMLSFPQYHTPTGKLILEMLHGSHAPDPKTVHKLLAHNRQECAEKIERASESCDYVILDRYVHSNMAYGVANGLDRAWLRSLDKNLPEPDLVVFLDVEFEEASARKRENRDAFESDAELARRVSAEYRRMAQGDRWHRLDASKSKAEVHLELLKVLGLEDITSRPRPEPGCTLNC